MAGRKSASIAVLLTFVFSLLSAVGVSARDFNDVGEHWARTAISDWADRGVLTGYENDTFLPDNNLTRAEMAAVLNRVFKYTAEVDGNPFGDVDETAWYAGDILKLNAAGIMMGSDGNANPNSNITRNEVAVLFTRAFWVSSSDAPTDFSDEGDIPEWAIAGVKALKNAGYISGYEGKFWPENNVTRAEVVTILNNMVQYYYAEPGDYSGQTFDGNVLVASGANLTNSTVNGNVYVAQGAGNLDVDLTGSAVNGCVYADAGNVILGAGADADRVMYNNSGSRLQFGGGTVGELILNAPANVVGTGKVETLTQNNGVTTTLPSTVTIGTVTTPTYSSGGGSSRGSTGGSPSTTVRDPEVRSLLIDSPNSLIVTLSKSGSGAVFSVVINGAAVAAADYTVSNINGTTYRITFRYSLEQNANVVVTGTDNVDGSADVQVNITRGNEMLIVNDTKQLTVNGASTWKTSDNTVVTVDNNGLITAVKEGSAVISVSNGAGAALAYYVVIVHAESSDSYVVDNEAGYSVTASYFEVLDMTLVHVQTRAECSSVTVNGNNAIQQTDDTLAWRYVLNGELSTADITVVATPVAVPAE